jgi:2-dehydro-3-deoxyphosphogalactonate aldolase
MDNLSTWLERGPLVAILRGVKPNEAEAIGDVLVQEGITIIEVPLNSPQPFESIARLVAKFGDRALIGAGTVMRTTQVREIYDVGGQLVVMPHADPTVVAEAKQAGLIAIPGFFTATEAFTCLDAGADALKLFPAEVAGPAALSAMRAVLPRDTIVMPMGGIDALALAKWQQAGARGFGIGSAIYRPGDSPGTVQEKARTLVEATARLAQKR